MKFVVCVSAFMVLWIVCHSICVIAHKDDTQRHPVGAGADRYVKIGAAAVRDQQRDGIYERRRNV